MEVLDFWIPREINSTEEVIPDKDSTPGIDSSNPKLTYLWPLYTKILHASGYHWL
jgi:hypothetical protein